MKLRILSLLFMCASLQTMAQLSAPDIIKTSKGELSIQPVEHASLVLNIGNTVIYVDPAGDATHYKGLAAPGIILITDIHGDHFDIKAIEALKTDNTVLVVPLAVAAKLPPEDRGNMVVIHNGASITESGIVIDAIPMYNLPESPTAMHPKGRGNGYVLHIGGKNIYISGDTQGIPEMRALKDLDVAFVCMNLPYTMDINEAADAVLAFKPKIVYPFHYRGKDGMSDVNKFKNLVAKRDKKIEVRLRNWYPTF